MEHEKYDRIVDALSRAGSIDEIQEQCSVLSEITGFDLFQYGAVIPNACTGPVAIIISGYPPEWLGHYLEQGYIGVDPVVTHCCSKMVAMNWEETKPMEQECKKIRKFMGESRDFGLKSGLSFPVHTPHGGLAILSLASSCKDHSQTKSFLNKTIPLVHQAAFHVHEAVQRVIGTSAMAHLQDPLTEREKDCLLWTADGKTSWETAKILGISERTVKYHLQNACVKLNAVNRSQAIARAVSLGLIRPTL